MGKNNKSGLNGGLIFFGILLVIMFITKPDKRDFENFINNQIEDNSETLIEEWLTKFGSSIASVTKTEDFIFFTANSYSVMDETVTYIGVFGYFIPVPE